jgi:hypothetical protein
VQGQPTVLYLPKSGEATWYFATSGMINVSSINELSWNGNAFKFVTTYGPLPFAVAGEVKDDGTIHGSLEATTAAGRVPFAEFLGTRN